MCSCRAPRVTRGAACFPACEFDGTPGKLAKYPSRLTRITCPEGRFRGHIETNVASLLVALARPAIHKTANWSVKDGELVMEETIEIRDTVAPAAEFPKVRDFFDLIAGVQNASVVFIKQ